MTDEMIARQEAEARTTPLPIGTRITWPHTWYVHLTLGNHLDAGLYLDRKTRTWYVTARNLVVAVHPSSSRGGTLAAAIDYTKRIGKIPYEPWEAAPTRDGRHIPACEARWREDRRAFLAAQERRDVWLLKWSRACRGCDGHGFTGSGDDVDACYGCVGHTRKRKDSSLDEHSLCPRCGRRVTAWDGNDLIGHLCPHCGWGYVPDPQHEGRYILPDDCTAPELPEYVLECTCMMDPDVASEVIDRVTRNR